MINLSSPELFINMQYTPTKDSSEYSSFWQEEKRKCREGVTINGFYFSPFLYWHINHWAIRIDVEKQIGKFREVERIKSVPLLRDNELLFAEAELKAQEERQALLILGLRQFAKSELIASYTARSAILNQHSQNIVVGGNSEDLTSITEKIDFGLLNCSPYFRSTRITRDWDSKEVHLGYKNKDGDNVIWSTFKIRNTQDGRKTEAVAGTTIKSLIFDEVGKYPFSQPFEAAKPALLSSFGWRCVPILMGTGGSFEKGKDAEIAFFNPDSNDIYGFIEEKTGRKTGLFVPGTYRQDCKVEKTLSEHLGLKTPSELDLVKVRISDHEKAKALIKQELEDKAKDPDPVKYLKHKMYYPLEVDDIFLSVQENIFPVSLVQGQLQFVRQNSIKSENVELFLDNDGKVRHKFTDKRPISNYPIRPEDQRDGVIQIWEMPISDAPFGLYVAGSDPYKQSQAIYSDSLGSTYIYKRVHNLTGEGWMNMPVACYVGRPKKIEKWYENTKLLLKFFNCKTLCENMDYGFIQHCVEKNEAHIYQEKTPSFLTDIHPNTTVQRDYGIHMTKDIKHYLYTIIIEYLTEEISKEILPDGEVRVKYGVSRILDPVLLEELLKFRPDGNFDRIISFGLALAKAKELNAKNIRVTEQQDNRLEAYFSVKPRKSPFRTTTSNPFR